MENKNIENLINIIANMNFDTKKIKIALSRVIHYELAKLSKEERENIINTCLENFISYCLTEYNIVLDSTEIQIVIFLVKKYNFDKIDEYNNLDKKTKFFVDEIIWTKAMGEEEIYKFVFLYCGFYNKYKDALGEDIDFITNEANAQYGIIKNIEKLMNIHPEKTMVYIEILKDLEENKELINAYSTTIAIIINIFKLIEQGKLGKELKDSLKQYKITYSDICEIFNLNDEYYGILGLYQEEYEKMRDYLFQKPFTEETKYSKKTERFNNNGVDYKDIINLLKSSIGQEMIEYIQNYIEIKKNEKTKFTRIADKNIGENTFNLEIISSLLPNVWNKLSDVEKIKILQNIENIMSRIQNRTSRKVVQTKLDSNGEYNFYEPTVIKIFNLQDGIQSAITIIHEGIHAMYHDATLGKIGSVITFYDTKESTIKNGIKNRDIIHNHFYQNKMIEVFQVQNVEDRIAYYDSCMFLMLALLTTPNVNSEIIRYYTRCVLERLLNYYRICDYYKNLYNIDYIEELNNIDYEKYKDKENPVANFNIIKNNSIKHVQELISNILYNHETMPKGYQIGSDESNDSKSNKLGK